MREQEQEDYNDLVQWLDRANETLLIVDRPVHNREQEYLVICFASFSSNKYLKRDAFELFLSIRIVFNS